jgi:hypothetical protein
MTTTEICTHHWLIPAAVGIGKSTGTGHCKRCGEAREFTLSGSDAPVWTAQGHAKYFQRTGHYRTLAEERER